MYTCYACNKTYNVDPRPFWICPACTQKRNENPPLLPMYWIIKPAEQDGIRKIAQQSKEVEA